jgi:hypothetical protein
LFGLAAALLRLARTYGRLGLARQLGVAWLGLALVVVWAEVGARSFFTVLNPEVYIPTARYSYPVIVPTMLLLVAGWSYWPRATPAGGPAPQQQRLWRAVRQAGPLLFWVGFLILDVASAITIANYYLRRY